MKQVTPGRLFLRAGFVAIIATSCFASVGFAGPNGQFGRERKWLPAWSRMFAACFEKHGKRLAQTQPSDKANYCFDSSVRPVDYWLSIFIPLAYKESGFNPSARGRNGRQVPQGLYQMDRGDMRRHRCEGTNPNDPRMAICCAIKIADNQAKRGRRAISSGRSGIMADFWQPMRNGGGGNGRGGRINNTPNHDMIKSQAKLLCMSKPSERTDEIAMTRHQGRGRSSSPPARPRARR